MPRFTNTHFLMILTISGIRCVLNRCAVYPLDTDPATKLLLEEAAQTYAKMSDEQIATFVTVEDFQYYWQRANERISSSYSGLHFGHYKAASYDKDLSALHAAKLPLCAKTGVPLARWGRGLTIPFAIAVFDPPTAVHVLSPSSTLPYVSQHLTAPSFFLLFFCHFCLSIDYCTNPYCMLWYGGISP